MFIASPDDSTDAARNYKSSSDSDGFVMNWVKAWNWRPDILEGFAALRGQLTAQATMTKREQALIVCATASELGDSYCSLAWGKTLSDEVGPASAAAVISRGEGGTLSKRDKALVAWARKVVANPNGTSASDVEGLRAAGFDDREIFEVTVFVAFRLAFSTVNDALGIAPDWQLVESVPQEVREAVTFGRRATGG